MKHQFVAAGLTALVLGSAPASAGEEHDKGFYQKELEGWSSVIAELQEVDTRKRSSQEIERIRTLVSQGQAYLAADKLEEIDPLLDRSTALAALVRARSERVVAEQKADEAEAAAQVAEDSAAAARLAAEAAQQKFDTLEAKGL